MSEKSEQISSSYINIKTEYPTSEMKEKITEKKEYIDEVTTNMITINLSTTSPITIKDKTEQITEHTNQPEKNPEKTIEIRTYNTIKPDIMTNIPSTTKETEIKKNNQSISTTIITTLETISKTNIENITINTIKETQKPEIINTNNTQVVLLGFSHFRLYDLLISFYTYIIPIQNNIYSTTIRINAIITYYSNIRYLKETEGNCTLQNSLTEKKLQYLCKIYEETKNIKQIKVEPDYYFVSQENVSIIGISPLAKMFMHNIQKLDEKYDSISNLTIYILDNSTYYKYDKLLFNISGAIDGPKPKLDNKNLTLIVNLVLETKIVEEVNCSIMNILKNNYSLDCKANETILCDLQSAISYVDDGDILLINFATNVESIISTEKDIGAKNANKRFYYSKKLSSIKPGVIAAVIIIFIFVLAAIITMIYYNKKKVKNHIKVVIHQYII